MMIKSAIASLLLAVSFSSAVAYTGGGFHPGQQRCIVGEDCRDTCFTNANGEQECQTVCYLILGPCGPDDDGGDGGPTCDDTTDSDNAPDECPIHGFN